MFLLQNRAQIILFHWTIPGTQGRVADVDERNYLKCIVPVGAKRFAVNIADLQANILIPATGVRMVREKRTVGLRQPDNLNRLPNTLVRLIKMLRSAQSYCCDSEPELVTDEVCYVCLRPADLQSGDLDKVSPSQGLQGTCRSSEHASDDACEPHTTKVLKLCPVCLLASHSSCCKRVLQCFMRELKSGRAQPPPTDKCTPNDF